MTRRRRECLKCNKRYTTYERLESTALTIVKKDGSREQFDRAKVLAGLLKECEKTKVTREDIDKIIDGVECDLKSMDVTEIPSKKVGVTIMKRLKRKDKVAYIRFASVYRSFADITLFEKEVQKLTSKS